MLCFFSYEGTGKRFTGGQYETVKKLIEWQKKGIEIHIIQPEEGVKLCNKLNFFPIIHTYKPCKTESLSRFIIEDLINVKRMLAAVPNIDFDCIFCPGEPFKNIVPSYMSKRKMKIPFVTAVKLSVLPNRISDFINPSNKRGSSLSQNFKTIVNNLIDSFMARIRNVALRNADLIFATGTPLKNECLALGVDNSRIFSVPSGIDTDLIKAKPKISKTHEACFVGTISKRKGIDDLIEIWSHVVKEEPQAKIVLIGSIHDTSYVDSILRKIEENKIQDNIAITGFIEDDEKIDIIEKSKLFVFPSLNESYAIVVSEALSLGLPVIAYELPCYNEWYGDSLIYIKIGNKRDFADAIIELLRNASKRKELEKKAIKISEKYSLNELATFELNKILHLIANQ